MKPYYDKDGITIYNADCREILPHLPKVDLVLTSPPYLNLRDYTTGPVDWYELVPPALSLVEINAQGQVLCNLGLCASGGSVLTYWDALHSAMNAKGFRLFGWYVWDKGMAHPGDYAGRFAPVHEFLFHYNRKSVELNRTVPAPRAGQPQRTAFRMKDGSIAERKYTNPENSHKVLDSVIRCYPAVSPDDRNGHPAPFPRRFGEILISAFPAQTILDPFMGSGTTLVAAKQLGRKCIGIELEEKYCEIAVNRLAQGNLFTDGAE